MEITSIHLKTTKSTLFKLFNVYLPNTITQQNSFYPSVMQPTPTSIILGNSNGLSQLWNLLQHQVCQGDKTLDWILENDLHILHDGSARQTS